MIAVLFLPKSLHSIAVGAFPHLPCHLPATFTALIDGLGTLHSNRDPDRYRRERNPRVTVGDPAAQPLTHREFGRTLQASPQLVESSPSYLAGPSVESL